MITRKSCPGPFHDAVANHYAELAKLAPSTAAEFLAHKHGLAPHEVISIAAWCKRPTGHQCPVGMG